MKKLGLLLLVGMLVLVVFSACGTKKEGGGVVAKVGNMTVSTDDLNQEWSNASRMVIQGVSEYERKQDLVKKLIGDKVVLLEAYKEGIDNEVEQDTAFAKQKETILLNVLYKKEIVDKSKATESEIKDEYNKQKEEIHAVHILVETKEEADNIYQQLKNGADFTQLAKEKSIDPSAKNNGGDLGFFGWGKMVPEFQDVAFKLKTGEISRPVQTQYGWHIIKLIEKRSVEQTSYEEAKKMIQSRLEQTKREQRVKEYFEELKKKVGFKINDQALDLIQSRKVEVPPDSQGLSKTGETVDVSKFTSQELSMPLFTYQGGEVSVGTFVQQFNQMPQPYRPRLSDKQKIGEIAFQTLIRDMLLNVAKKENLEKNEEFAKEWDVLKEKEMIKRMRAEVILKGVGISDEEIQSYYDRFKDRFTVPAQVKVREIMVKTPEEAEVILKQLKQGSDFSKLASEKTIREYVKGSGGDLGSFPRTRYPEIFDAAIGLKKGDLAGPIKIQDRQLGIGYSVIKLEDKTEAKVQPLEEVKDRVTQMARAEKDNNIYNQWVENAKARYKIEVFDDVIKSTIPETKADSTKRG
ncbi:MAG: peptidylprolyl isomerase [Candidatus Zixiibacteriota bacterium]